MEVGELLARLRSCDQEERQGAVDALVEAGEVEPVIAELRAEIDHRTWPALAEVLWRIGDPAYEPLVRALAAEPRDSYAHLWLRLALVKGADRSRVVDLLGHPSPAVRAAGARAVGRAGEPAPGLVPLLVDDDEDVRRLALEAFKDIGPAAVPLLRAVRRSPAKARRKALAALLESDGVRALDAVDRRVVDRWIGHRIAHEVPEPMHVCGEWYAVPSDDQDSVLEACGLSDPMPITMRIGGFTWNHDNHDWDEEGHVRCSRMYVSPVLDGWTLVFGDPVDQDHARPRDLWTAELSRRFGAAHWYGLGCGKDWTAWAFAENGRVVRKHSSFSSAARFGPPHPAEEGFRLPDGIGPLFLVDDGDPPFGYATDIAGRASVDPTALGAHTVRRGQGVLALTACGRRHGIPRGLPEI